MTPLTRLMCGLTPPTNHHRNPELAPHIALITKISLRIDTRKAPYKAPYNGI